MTDLPCPACGRAVQLPRSEFPLPDPLPCPTCGAWIESAAAQDQPASTLLVDSELDEAECRPSVGVVGQLLLSNSGLAGPFPLHAAKTVVGRQGADITVADPALSSRHFEIENRGAEFLIRDLESTNGTRVNGRLIRATELRSGDRIEAGTSHFLFRTLHAVRWDGPR